MKYLLTQIAAFLLAAALALLLLSRPVAVGTVVQYDTETIITTG